MHEGNQTLFYILLQFPVFFVELSNCKDTNQDFIYIIILIKSIVEIRWTNNIFMPSYFYFWIIENRHFPLLADFCATFGHQWVCKLHNCNIFDRWWQIFNHKIKLVKQAGSQCIGEDVYGGTYSTISIERDAISSWAHHCLSAPKIYKILEIYNFPQKRQICHFNIFIHFCWATTSIWSFV